MPLSTVGEPRADRPAESLATRYESLIRLAEAIRAGGGQSELFDVLTTELRQVVQFDGIFQYDEAAHKVRWLLCEGCTDPTRSPLTGLHSEDTVAWWVHAHQQVLVIPSIEH